MLPEESGKKGDKIDTGDKGAAEAWRKPYSSAVLHNRSMNNHFNLLLPDPDNSLSHAIFFNTHINVYIIIYCACCGRFKLQFVSWWGQRPAFPWRPSLPPAGWW